MNASVLDTFWENERFSFKVIEVVEEYPLKNKEENEDCQYRDMGCEAKCGILKAYKKAQKIGRKTGVLIKFEYTNKLNSSDIYGVDTNNFLAIDKSGIQHKSVEMYGCCFENAGVLTDLEEYGNNWRVAPKAKIIGAAVFPTISSSTEIVKLGYKDIEGSYIFEFPEESTSSDSADQEPSEEKVGPIVNEYDIQHIDDFILQLENCCCKVIDAYNAETDMYYLLSQAKNYLYNIDRYLQKLPQKRKEDYKKKLNDISLRLIETGAVKTDLYNLNPEKIRAEEEQKREEMYKTNQLQNNIENLIVKIYRRINTELTAAEKRKLDNDITVSNYSIEQSLGRIDCTKFADVVNDLRKIYNQYVEICNREKEASKATEIIKKSKQKVANVKELSPRQFEEFIADLFEMLGYIVKLTPQTGDEGIDIFIVKDERTIAVQCKKYTNLVGGPEIQRFIGAMRNSKAQKGIFITTSGYTMQAEKFASQEKIELIDEIGLEALIAEAFSKIDSEK